MIPEETGGLFISYRVDNLVICYKTIDEQGTIIDYKEEETDETIFVESALSQYEFSANEILSELETKEELRLKRNEIFAVHGYKFKSADLQEYFSEQPWYRPRFDDVTNKLTDTEKKNIETLLELEEQLD